MSAIARAAGVDRTFLYRHADLLAQLHLAQERPAAAENGGPVASRASLQADLASAQGQIARQACRVPKLCRRPLTCSVLGMADDLMPPARTR